MKMAFCTAGLFAICLTPIPEALAAEMRSDFARTQPRIINGVTVQPGQGPWAASLRRPSLADPSKRVHYCGGSLVAPKWDPYTDAVITWSPSDSKPEWLLTAAHCVVNNGEVVNASDLRALTGKPDFESSEPMEQGEEQSIDKIIVHERFDPKTLENDIALIKLSAPLKNVPHTLRQSISIPSVMDVEWVARPYLAVRAQGWGRTEQGYQSRVLKEVLLPLVDRQVCRNVYEPAGEKIADGMLCGGFVSGSFDSCQGDSGGPLIYRPQSSIVASNFSPEPRLIGVISWGIGCANANLYGIYTSALFYRRWLEDAVSKFYKGS